jgi:hypothetical protein
MVRDIRDITFDFLSYPTESPMKKIITRSETTTSPTTVVVANSKATDNNLIEERGHFFP